MRNLFRGAVVLLIAIAMVFSTVVIADTEVKDLELSTTNSGSGYGTIGDVVWDNGMDYDGLASTQDDSAYPYDCYVCDDFHFEEDTEVADVHWIGGYWNGDPAEFDWCIAFFKDDGSGEQPLSKDPNDPDYAGPFCYAWGEIEIEDLGDQYYLMSVDLPEPVFFPGCEKFWISIWGVGLFPPQSGWGMHQDPVTLAPAVWGSDFWGFVYWTPSFDVQGYDHDQCFQLTAATSAVPKICCDPMITQWKVKPEVTVTGKFHVINCGDDGSTLTWSVDSWPAWMTGAVFTPPGGTETKPGPGTEVTFTFTAPSAQQTYNGVIKVINEDDPTDFCEIPVECVVPRTKGIYFNIFERIINQFPILKALFGL